LCSSLLTDALLKQATAGSIVTDGGLGVSKIAYFDATVGTTYKPFLVTRGMIEGDLYGVGIARQVQLLQKEIDRRIRDANNPST